MTPVRSPLSLPAIIIAVSLLFASCVQQGESRIIPGYGKNTSSVSTQKTSKKTVVTRSSRSRQAVQKSSQASSAIPVPLTSYNIPVLVYHHIRAQEGWAKSTWSWKMTVTPKIFEQHMQWLVDHGYTTVTLDTLVQILRGERLGPEKPIVITFDDNNLSQYDVAVPILTKNNQVAVFYQVANRLDNPATLDRAKTKELSDIGMDIQSHTMTHRVLTALSDKDLEWEMKESKRLLEEATGKPVLHVAYPGTAQNPRVRDAAKAAGYVTGTIMDPRNMTEKDDWLKIPRIMMTDDTNLSKVLP